jgi:hypothetical protein
MDRSLLTLLMARSCETNSGDLSGIYPLRSPPVRSGGHRRFSKKRAAQEAWTTIRDDGLTAWAGFYTGWEDQPWWYDRKRASAISYRR